MEPLTHKILKKIEFTPGRRQHDRGSYSFYGTPTEIKLLIDHGARPAGYTHGLKEYEEKIAQGKGNPEWFYFTLKKDQLEKFGQKRNTKHKGK